MSKETLEAKLEENYEAQESLPARFTLWSGKAFTYAVRRIREGDAELRVGRIYRKGEKIDGGGTLILAPDGNVRYFTFPSFTGENAADLNGARIYFRDCAELLSPEFIAKVTADYESKIGDFKFLERQENEIRAAISEIEKRGGAA